MATPSGGTPFDAVIVGAGLAGLTAGAYLGKPVLTPIPRLLTAGHWAFSPGGSPVAVLTGKVAGEHVLRHSEVGG